MKLTPAIIVTIWSSTILSSINPADFNRKSSFTYICGSLKVSLASTLSFVFNFESLNSFSFIARIFIVVNVG